MERSFDIIVIGGGHAGSEAAHAAARLGLNTLLLTNNIDGIATMPCNPAIGGPAKSHLVKEIDAMGGVMGLAADATYLQMKTLNSSKGPAVRALRAQSDKREYAAWVRQYLESTPNLTIYQSEAKALIFDKTSETKSLFEKLPDARHASSENAELTDASMSSSRNEHNNADGTFRTGSKVIGVETNLEEKIYAKAVVLTAGTFLEGRIFSGDKFESAGRAGEKPSLGLSPKLRDLGLNTGRLKTGTPPRLDRKTIDFSNLELAPGDAQLEWFSFLPNRPVRPQYPCHITRTNARTHEIIMENLDKSPMYSGLVQASGPRYCPSIEDKVVRFSHNPSHHFFLEPEGLSTNEIYLQGCSTSLPVEVQWQLVRSLPGLEKAVITRPAYAVEYDYFPGIQFKHNFESKTVDGLFVAGQVLGTSGYEEAAAQGLMAGINAAHSVLGREPLILDRSSSYIATLVDDLVTKEINDPYRMLTSRSEYRLILRQDNADLRLTPIGREIGLVDDYRWRCFTEKQERISDEVKFVKHVRVGVANINAMLSEKGLDSITYKAGEKILLADLLKRDDVSFELKSLDLESLINEDDKEVKRLKEQGIDLESFAYGYEVETQVKYEGYITRQESQIEEMKKFDGVKIPSGFSFKACEYISLEARDKLDKVRPLTLGQASRVGGVTPNDVSVLSVMLSARKLNGEQHAAHAK